jgi:hypothetical protein
VYDDDVQKESAGRLQIEQMHRELQQLVAAKSANVEKGGHSAIILRAVTTHG